MILFLNRILACKFCLDEKSIKYLSNPIHWELFCNYNNPILVTEDLNLDNINKKIVHNLNYLENLEKTNKVYSFEEIIKITEAISELRMKNTKVCLNGLKKSVCEIRDNILSKYRKYFESRLKILRIN